MYGIDVGIDYSKINDLSQLVRELSGVQIPACRPFIGDGAYTIESGIVTGWYRQAYAEHPTTVYPVHPRFVGRDAPKILMGREWLDVGGGEGVCCCSTRGEALRYCRAANFALMTLSECLVRRSSWRSPKRSKPGSEGVLW